VFSRVCSAGADSDGSHLLLEPEDADALTEYADFDAEALYESLQPEGDDVSGRHVGALRGMLGEPCFLTAISITRLAKTCVMSFAR
jgi:hypothetical protein